MVVGDLGERGAVGGEQVDPLTVVDDAHDPYEGPAAGVHGDLGGQCLGHGTGGAAGQRDVHLGTGVRLPGGQLQVPSGVVAAGPAAQGDPPGGEPQVGGVEVDGVQLDRGDGLAEPTPASPSRSGSRTRPVAT